MADSAPIVPGHVDGDNVGLRHLVDCRRGARGSAPPSAEAKVHLGGKGRRALLPGQTVRGRRVAEQLPVALVIGVVGGRRSDDDRCVPTLGDTRRVVVEVGCAVADARCERERIVALKSTEEPRRTCAVGSVVLEAGLIVEEAWLKNSNGSVIAIVSIEDHLRRVVASRIPSLVEVPRKEPAGRVLRPDLCHKRGVDQRPQSVRLHQGADHPARPAPGDELAPKRAHEVAQGSRQHLERRAARLVSRVALCRAESLLFLGKDAGRQHQRHVPVWIASDLQAHVNAPVFPGLEHIGLVNLRGCIDGNGLGVVGPTPVGHHVEDGPVLLLGDLRLHLVDVLAVEKRFGPSRLPPDVPVKRSVFTPAQLVSLAIEHAHQLVDDLSLLALVSLGSPQGLTAPGDPLDIFASAASKHAMSE